VRARVGSFAAPSITADPRSDKKKKKEKKRKRKNPMSLAYAEALTYRDDLGGQLGAPEEEADAAAVAAGADALADLLAAAGGRAVVFTGAGLSTAAGVPDFRGPDGVWTRQRDGRPPPDLGGVAGGASFSTVRPTFSHAALASLARSGLISLVASQNVDGLHLRAGHPAHALVELHGNVFVESCARPACGAVWVRDFEVGSVGRRPTRRRCGRCGTGRLRDGVLDWEQALPEEGLAATEAAADGACLAVCLGTSLQISPACDLPVRTVRAGGTLAIVNLQPTPKDAHAGLVVRGRCDSVMRRVMARLVRAGVAGVPASLPPFVRTDAVLAAAELSGGGGGVRTGAKRARNPGGGGRATLTVRLACPDGDGGPAWPVTAMVAGLEVWVGGGGGGGGEGEEGQTDSSPTSGPPDAELDGPPWVVRLPVVLGGGGESGSASPPPLRVTLRLGLSPAADPGTPAPIVALRLPGEPGAAVRKAVSFVSQTVEWGPHEPGGEG
jgi:NAD-dependent SIR2 family protein deacetylase